MMSSSVMVSLHCFLLVTHCSHIVFGMYSPAQFSSQSHFSTNGSSQEMIDISNNNVKNIAATIGCIFMIALFFKSGII